MNWVQRMTKWRNLQNYNNANRTWFVNDVSRDTEMYVKEFDRFHFYWVLGGGHSVSATAAYFSCVCVYTIQPVVSPVIPPDASCKQGFSFTSVLCVRLVYAISNFLLTSKFQRTTTNSGGSRCPAVRS